MNYAVQSRIGPSLQAISEEAPCGTSLRDSALFEEIRSARVNEDPNLPRGVWERELKQADWAEVIDLCEKAIQTESIDLQVMAWQLEAHIRNNGLIGWEVYLWRLRDACLNYWEHLHPEMTDGDQEYRTNIFDWINAKFPNLIKRTLVTSGEGVEQLSWTDLESAFAEDVEHDSPDASSLVGRLEAEIERTPVSYYQELSTSLAEGLQATVELESILSEKLQGSHVSFVGLIELITEMLKFIEHLLGEDEPGADEISVKDLAEIEFETEASGLQAQDLYNSQKSQREYAYALLAEAVGILLEDDPHSPVPYIVSEAVNLGEMKTPQLYEELFVKRKGNLNLFELMGLENRMSINDRSPTTTKSKKDS